VRLWTIQPIEVLTEIESKGFFICNDTLSENLQDENFVKAYNWLVTEMEKRIGVKPKDVTYPIWAWHTEEWKHKKPDLRCAGHAKRGTKMICMELEIPDNEVLLSDFDKWHAVLNDWFNDTSTNEAEWEEQHDWFDNLPKSEQEKVKLESWSRIFNTEPFQNDWTSNGRYIQATFWKLEKTYIKKVQHFTAK
jgi:hypothetical protein